MGWYILNIIFWYFLLGSLFYFNGSSTVTLVVCFLFSIAVRKFVFYFQLKLSYRKKQPLSALFTEVVRWINKHIYTWQPKEMGNASGKRETDNLYTSDELRMLEYAYRNASGGALEKLTQDRLIVSGRKGLELRVVRVWVRKSMQRAVLQLPQRVRAASSRPNRVNFAEEKEKSQGLTNGTSPAVPLIPYRKGVLVRAVVWAII